MGAVERDLAAHVLHDPFGERKAKTGALSDFLGGKKRFEDFVFYFRRDAMSKILDLDCDRVADANAMPGWTVSTYLASLVATLSDKCELITRAGQLVLEIGLAAQQRRDEAEILLQAQEALFKELAALRPAEYCKRRRASAEDPG